MKNVDLTKLVSGIVAVVVGILIAVLGIGNVMNTYLAILAIVSGSVLLIYGFYFLYTKKMLPLPPLALGGALIAIGVGVFTNYISFEVLIWILVFSFFGVGGALVVFGVYIAVKRNPALGIGFIVIGGGLIALAACYLAFNDFRKVFWIITGILIAVSGALDIVYAIVEKKK